MRKEPEVFINHTKFFLVLFFLFGVGVQYNYAQISNYVSSVKVGDAKEKTPLAISADLFSSENISQIDIAFKTFGKNEYLKREMLLTGNTASVTIPADEIQPPYLEYYIILSLKDGTSQTYPLGVDHGVAPIQIPISAVSEKDKQILVLSPDAGEMLTQHDMLISISFVKAPNQVDISKTKIYLNDQDVSSFAVNAGDLLVISGDNFPSNLGFGSLLLKVEVYDKSGNIYHSISRSFQLVTEELAAQAGAQWKYYGSLRGESRNENYNSASTWYNNLGADFTGTVDQWRLNGSVYLTSEEKSNRQPYNRYSATVQNGDWLDLKFGDAFPRFPSLIMDGKRVRGFSGALNFGAFNIQTSFGETVRNVEGELLEKYTAANAPLGSNIISINQLKYPGYQYGKVNMGTYNRNVFVLRPSFGSGENFQFGLTYLHSKDDPGSIEFGARPQENLVFGSDLMFAFDDQNVMFTSQAAFSLVNKDISSGNLSDAQIDSVFGPNSTYSNVDPGTVKKYKDLISKFITVNQYLGPWNPQELSSFAGEAALSLNYFDNTLRTSYIYRGNDYQSFGQSFLRTDVKGINFIDRARFMDNKLFVSIGYESLNDNLQKTKIATTTFETISASVSYFPRTDFPNVTIGYNRYANNNGLVLADTLKNRNAMFAVDDITDRVSLAMSYDFIAGVRHSSSFSFTTSSRTDNSLAKANATFNMSSLNVTSYWTSQLMSLCGIVYSASEISGQPFNYLTITVGGKYRLLENKLQLSASLSPSFGDFERQALELVADYNVLANLNLVFQTRIFRIPGSATNSIIGLTTRLSI